MPDKPRVPRSEVLRRAAVRAKPQDKRKPKSPASGKATNAPQLRAALPHPAVPLPKSNFRVFFDADEVDVASVSPLHLPDGKLGDPDIRQTVVLRRAVGGSQAFFAWNLACRSGKTDGRTVTITLLNGPGGKSACIWQLTGARAVRWTGPDFDALANEIAMEELEISYESIEWRTRT
tara:strand:+ start:263 stop:793 length:531 start_codon:yes stop_codon:yes gene_type:complete